MIQYHSDDVVVVLDLTSCQEYVGGWFEELDTINDPSDTRAISRPYLTATCQETLRLTLLLWLDP